MWSRLRRSRAATFPRLDRAPQGFSQDLCHFCEGHEAWAGDFVPFAQMPILCQRCDDHICDIVNVDDRLCDIAAGHGKDTVQYWVAQVAFGKVLRKPRGPHDGKAEARIADHLFAHAGEVLAPARKHRDGV